MASSVTTYNRGNYSMTVDSEKLQAKKETIFKMIPQFQKALPDFFKPERFARICCNLLVPKDAKDMQRVQALLSCSPDTFFGALLACAQLGLEPDGLLGQAYLIPFNGRCQMILGYKGLIDLARRSGEMSSIVAHEVRENDMFNFDFGTCELPHHTFDLTKPRGEVIAFYAIARFKDGSYHFDLMTKEEVDSIRSRSQSARMGSSPWNTDYVEMGKKTIIRRIAKYLPMNVQRACMYDDTSVRTSKDSEELVIDTSFDETETSEQKETFQNVRSQLLEASEAEESKSATAKPKSSPKKQVAQKTETEPPHGFDWYIEATNNASTSSEIEKLETLFKEDSTTFNDGDYCTVINAFEMKKEQLKK